MELIKEIYKISNYIFQFVMKKYTLSNANLLQKRTRNKKKNELQELVKFDFESSFKSLIYGGHKTILLMYETIASRYSNEI